MSHDSHRLHYSPNWANCLRYIFAEHLLLINLHYLFLMCETMYSIEVFIFIELFRLAFTSIAIVNYKRLCLICHFRQMLRLK